MIRALGSRIRSRRRVDKHGTGGIFKLRLQQPLVVTFYFTMNPYKYFRELKLME